MDKFLRRLFKSKHKRAYFALMFIVLCLPVIILSVLMLQLSYGYLTKTTLSTRQSIAHLATVNLKQTFDGLISLGVSFVTRRDFIQRVSEKNHDEAIRLLGSVQVDFPQINRVFIVDMEGTLLADTPHLPGVVGKNFADRDWYHGVVRDWKPYISEIYKRAAEPQYNMIAVAIPVRDIKQEPVAILVLQVSIDNMTDWTKRTEVGTGGFVYFVDKKGQVAGHPKSSLDGEILDFSFIPLVQKVLRGESGVEVNFNPFDKEERLSAYESVPKYNWGAVATQPTINAFAGRTEAMFALGVVLSLILVLNIVATRFFLKILFIIERYRERQEVFLGSIGDAVMAIDRNFIITLFNSSASRLTGFSQGEAVGKPMRDIVKFVNEDNKTENIIFIEEAMLFGKTQHMANHVVLITKMGTEIPIGDSAAPIFDMNGVVTGAIIVFRDVSHEQEVQRMKDEFVALASHELRTPMTSIAGFVDMILNGRYGPITKDLREPLGYVAESTDRLIRLVNDLLNVSRIEGGRLSFTLGRIGLRATISKIVAELKPVAEKRNVALFVGAGEEVFVQADKEKVEQILHNIIGNSLKFTDKGGVSVAIRISEDMGVVEVVDTGIGIPKEGLDKLFGKFEQIHTDPASRPPGTGLGLYVSRQIARKMGGDVILARSEFNKGSTFEFHAPLADSPRAKKVSEDIIKKE